MLDGSVRRVAVRGNQLRGLAVSSLCSTALLVLCLAPRIAAADAALDSGDILVAGWNALVKVDPVTGEAEELLGGEAWPGASDVAVAGNGMIYTAGGYNAAQSGRDVQKFDPLTGEIELLAGDLPINAIRRIHVDRNGDLLVLGGRNWPYTGIVRVDPRTGESEVAFASAMEACESNYVLEIPPEILEILPWFPPPGWDPEPAPPCMPLPNHEMFGQTMQRDGKVLLMRKPWTVATTYNEGIHRVDLHSGEVEEVAPAYVGLLKRAFDVVVSHDGRIFVANNNTEPGSPSCAHPCNQIIEVDPDTGATSYVTGGAPLSGGQWDLEMDREGRILSLSLAGGLVRIDPDTGQQEPLASLSSGSRGIAVYGMVQYPVASRISGDREVGPHCGLGFELGLLLVALSWRRNRRA